MKTSKIVGTIIICFGLFLLSTLIYQSVVGEYSYQKNYKQLWTLADRSSTIAAKHEYLSKFYNALRTGRVQNKFSDNDACWFKTPANEFDANLEALHTLVNRLAEIKTMDPNSFQYNTAIQQITAQEQGEAKEMLDVFYGCYFLAGYPLVWGWIGMTMCLVTFILIFVGSMTIYVED